MPKRPTRQAAAAVGAAVSLLKGARAKSAKKKPQIVDLRDEPSDFDALVAFVAERSSRGLVVHMPIDVFEYIDPQRELRDALSGASASLLGTGPALQALRDWCEAQEDPRDAVDDLVDRVMRNAARYIPFERAAVPGSGVLSHYSNAHEDDIELRHIAGILPNGTTVPDVFAALYESLSDDEKQRLPGVLRAAIKRIDLVIDAKVQMASLARATVIVEHSVSIEIPIDWKRLAEDAGIPV